MKKFRKKWQNQKGFTLIEMIIVLFIISLLSLVFIPNVVQTKSKVDADGKNALRTVITTQAELYKMQNNEAPKNLDDLLKGNYISKEQKEQAETWEIQFP